MALRPPGPPEDRHDSGKRLRLIAPREGALPPGVGPWLIVHVDEGAAQGAAEDIKRLAIPEVHRVVRRLDADFKHIGAWAALIIVLWLGDDDPRPAAQEEARRSVGGIRLQYERSRPAELQLALRGEVEFPEAGALQVIGHRRHVNEQDWVSVLWPCYVHPVDIPEQDPVDLAAPYLGRHSLASVKLATGSGLASQVDAAIDFLARWNVAPEHAATVVRAFEELRLVVERDEAKWSTHRPVPGVEATALDFILRGQYHVMLPKSRRRTGMQLNIANMAKLTVVPGLEERVPGLRKPGYFRVQHLFLLYTFAKLLAEM